MKIIQISDLHLYQSADTLMHLRGLGAPFNTDQSFTAVLNLIIQQESDADLILVTGDIAEEPIPETYQRITKRFQHLPAPLYCIPGNHDNPNYLQKYLNDGKIHSVPFLDINSWRIIFLDTSKPNHPDGHLSEEQIEQLQTYLQTDLSVLIAMHHHPIPIQSRWMDNIRLQSPEVFLDIVSKNANIIKGVLFGHIHQAFNQTYDNVDYLGCISTGLQFTPNKENIELADNAPGYRKLHLNSDDTITSSIHRITTQ